MHCPPPLVKLPGDTRLVCEQDPAHRYDNLGMICQQTKKYAKRKLPCYVFIVTPPPTLSLSLSQPLPLTDEEMRSTHASLAIKQFQLDHQTGSSIGRRREDTTGCGPVNRRLNRLSYRRVTGKTPDFALLEGVSGFKSSLRRKIFFFPSFSCMELFSTFFSF